jgi:sugar lactone lactonase YvrE
MRSLLCRVLICGLLALDGMARAAPPAGSDNVAELNAAAMQAYRAKDFAAFANYEKRALALAPDNPRLIYNVACAAALQHDAAEAVRLLEQLLARKLDLGAETDGDFAAIHDTEAWARVVARLAELRKPMVQSKVAFTIPDKTLMATGIAVDPQTQDTYIASVRQRKILRRSKSGVIGDFVAQGQDGFLAGASLAVDGAHRLLFASSSAVPFMLGYDKADNGRSGLFVYDLQTGKLSRKAFLVNDGKRHFLNALVIDRDGNAYVSDSGASGIYVLRRDKNALETFLAPGALESTQGLALSDDEKTLYVADFANGLWSIDVASRARRRLAAPPGVWLGGLDGLSRARDGLISVQIGVRPERVVRLRLDAAGQQVKRVDILEMSHPDYAGPIQGVVTGNEFIYVANSQLQLGNGDTGELHLERARPTIILRLPL